MKKMKKAFTITELVIVIAVIAILSAVLIPTFSNVVENAKKSSSLQTCRNALTEYMTYVSTDEDTSNDDATGMVFEKDGYVYVYLSGSLRYIGELKKLAAFKKDAIENKEKLTNAQKIAIGDVTSVTSLTIALGSAAGASSKLINVSSFNGEILYFYSVTVNRITWNGYFVMNVTENNEYVFEGANYSSIAGALANNTEATTDDELVVAVA